MNLLSEKIAVVTGVSTGIGWATVETFIEHGARVIGVARREPPDLATLKDKSSFTFVRGDLTEKTTIERVAETAAEKYGRVDVLVNNAAILHTGALLEEATDSDWDLVLQTNLLSVVRLSARLLPLMRTGSYGRIINIGSVLSIYGTARGGPYVASKHAVLGLTRTQALEYGPLGITANCVLPGAIDTQMFREGDSDGAFRRQYEAQCPLARMGQPREMAETILFLASSLSSYVTGHALVADGGLTVGV